MLDLKAKLLAAGLVTQDQVNKVEQEKEAKRLARKQQKNGKERHHKSNHQAALSDDDYEQKQRRKQVEQLKALPKSDQYAKIRGWVERNRLDKPDGTLSETAEKYFFPKVDGTVTWLTLEKAVHDKIIDGSAGVMLFMSNYGLTHCVVPRDIAEDVAEVFPLWLRVLKDHPGAGQIDQPAVATDEIKTE